MVMRGKIGFDKIIKRPIGGQREKFIEDKEKRDWSNFICCEGRSEMEEGEVSIVKDKR